MTGNILLTLVSLAFVGLGILVIARGEGSVLEALPGLLFFAGCAAVGLIDTLQGAWPVRPEATADALVLRFNRVRLGVITFAAALWLAAGALGAEGAMPVWLTILLIAFAGFCTAIGLLIVLDGRPQVVIDREGIADYQIVGVKIPWTDVQQVGFGAWMEVYLTQPEFYAGKRSLRGRLFGRSVAPMITADNLLTGTQTDMAQAVHRFAPAHVTARPVAWHEPDRFDEGDDEQ